MGSKALFGSPSRRIIIPNPNTNILIINVKVDLQQVVDLTLPEEQKKLHTSAQELTGDWRGYHERSVNSSVSLPIGSAPTQELGEALYKLPKLEAFRAISAKVPDQMNLIVFPQKLLVGSRISYHDAAGQLHEIIGSRSR